MRSTPNNLCLHMKLRMRGVRFIVLSEKMMASHCAELYVVSGSVTKGLYAI
jgi:hypothetical protein